MQMIRLHCDKLQNDFTQEVILEKKSLEEKLPRKSEGISRQRIKCPKLWRPTMFGN